MPRSQKCEHVFIMSIIRFSVTMATKEDSGLEATRQQVNEVQNIMKDNVDKIMEREGKLSHLEERADQLQAGTEQFHRAAVKIKRKKFWENMKMKIVIGVVISVLIIIIIIVASS